MALVPAQVPVTTAATPLTTADTDSVVGQRVTVYVPGGTGVYLGGAAVTAASGFLVPGGASFSERLDAGESLYAVAASGSVTVHVLRAGA